MIDIQHIVAPSSSEREKLSIFLAGGITNCPNWQREAVESLASRFPRSLRIFNPRQENWNMDSDWEESRRQIQWEKEHLNIADGTLFWFPEETLCPITLFELGVASAGNKPLFVGCHINYKRRLDVIEQLKLARPEVTVRSSLGRLVNDVCENF